MFGINRVCVALGSRKCVVRWEKKMNDEPDVQLEPLKTIELNWKNKMENPKLLLLLSI